MKSKFRALFSKFLVFSLLVSLFFLNFSIRAESNQTTINYLEGQTPDPWITMALSAAGKTGLYLDHLKEVSGNLATDYEKTILALTSAGEDPRSFGNIDFVNQLRNFYQNNQIGSIYLLNDDFWGILALSSAGEPILNQIIQDSKDFVLANQNGDGGWGYAVSGQSDTNDTAVAIMALLEAGVLSDEPAIIRAINYLKINQNDDGGFPYLPGGESDSGSNAWVISAIYKLGQDPYNWVKNNKNPIDHLRSLQKSDGSFKWVASDESGYPVLTAYSLIALSQKYYPINRINRLPSLRIEGENTICSVEVSAVTALDTIKNGAAICGYIYFIEETNWGPYLKKINQEEAHDLIGWLFFVNNELPSIGANDYILKPGDEVLWYFGEWGWKPTRLILDKQKAEPGGDIKAGVEYFEESSWKPLADAAIYVGSQVFTTNHDGKADLIIEQPGIYQVWAEKQGYIRSRRMELLVGEDVSQNVELKVEITPPFIPEIALLISESQLDFGKLSPGATAYGRVLVKNVGNLGINLESTVSGDQVFREKIILDSSSWFDFGAAIGAGLEKDIVVGLSIPEDWKYFGIKEGNLIFWATANQ